MRAIFFSCLLLLAGCSEPFASDKELAERFALLQEKEREANSYAKKIRQLERKEQRQFTKTMELTQQQFAEVAKRSAALRKSAKHRLVLAEKEEALFEEAEKIAAPLKKTLDNHEERKALSEAVKERYAVRRSFLSNYKLLAEMQIQLYTQLENKEASIEELETAVAEVNEQLRTAESQTAEFNELTHEINQLLKRLENEE